MTAVPQVTLNDGHTIPQLGLGVWQMDPDDCLAATLHALHVGYRHIDTAAAYGNEEAVGRAITESGVPPEKIFVTTKLANTRHRDAEAALDESLSRLRLDHVDLYLIHWPVPSQDAFLDAWRSLVGLRDAGKAASIGVSNFTEEHLSRIIDATGVVPAVNQIELHPSFARFDEIQVHRTLGIATESWSPLGQGEDLDADVVIDIAEELGQTPAQVVIRWHLQRGVIVIPKSVARARIEENFDVFGFELGDEHMKRMHDLDLKNRIGPDPRILGA